MMFIVKTIIYLICMILDYEENIQEYEFPIKCQSKYTHKNII